MGKQSGKEDGRCTGMEVVAGNDDLLTQILLRLPVRSLLRSKSVSKHWLSLISDPKFCALKTERCCKLVSGVLLKPLNTGCRDFEYVALDPDCPAQPFETLDFLSSEAEFDAIECCNGLLSCRTERHASTDTETKRYIINPTTKQHTVVSLPVSTGKGIRLQLDYVGLAFDPRKSPHFKLICLFRDFGDAANFLDFGDAADFLDFGDAADFLDFGDAADFCVRIFSSETGLITQLSDIFHSSSGSLWPNGIYWNGAINWISSRSDGLYFNVDEERFGILPMPPQPQGRARIVDYYGESNDHLYLVYHDTFSATQFDVYEMDRDYSGWFVRFHVDLGPMFRAFPTIFERKRHGSSILAIVDEDDGENSFILFGISGKTILRFHLKDGVFTWKWDFSSVDDVGYVPSYHWSQCIPFIESLHPL